MQLQGGVVCITHIPAGLGSGAAGATRYVFSARHARNSGQINKDRSKGGKKIPLAHTFNSKRKSVNKKGPSVQQTLQKNALRQGCDSAVQDSNLQF